MIVGVLSPLLRQTKPVTKRRSATPPAMAAVLDLLLALDFPLSGVDMGSIGESLSGVQEVLRRIIRHNGRASLAPCSRSPPDRIKFYVLLGRAPTLA